MESLISILDGINSSCKNIGDLLSELKEKGLLPDNSDTKCNKALLELYKLTNESKKNLMYWVRQQKENLRLAAEIQKEKSRAVPVKLTFLEEVDKLIHLIKLYTNEIKDVIISLSRKNRNQSNEYNKLIELLNIIYRKVEFEISGIKDTEQLELRAAKLRKKLEEIYAKEEKNIGIRYAGGAYL